MTDLIRFYSPFKHRSASYYNPVSGSLFSEDSRVHELGKNAPLEKILTACDTRVLYLLPSPNIQKRYPHIEQWYAIPGVKVKRVLSNKRKGGTPACTVSYQGKQVSIYPIELWFGMDAGPVLKTTIQSHRAIKDLLDKHFQPYQARHGEHFPVELLATPAMQGLDLLMRSLPYGKHYEPLPLDETEILFNHLTQARTETFYHGEEQIAELYDYDGRWMYAACLRHVPVGPMIHDTEPEIAYTPPSKTGTRGFIAGFYQVRVRVPDNWNHIGLLPLKTVSGSRKWEYPNEPGREFTTWVGSPELSLAIKQGWHIEVMERLLWPETDTEPEPLKMWGERLLKLRMEIAETYPEPMRSMIRDAMRNILLHAIGSFNRYIREYDVYVHEEDLDTIPDYALPEPVNQDKDNDLWHYTVPQTLAGYNSRACQAQWCHFIWSTARKKLAENALQVPFHRLVALRTDAIWTSAPVVFPDTGKVGQFTRKPLHNNVLVQWPRDNGDMKRLVQKVRGEE